MKATDFAPRTGIIECALKGINLIGAEVGCDVGAHAESILMNCSIDTLHLVDVWLNPFCEGYCEGRLSRWRNRIKTYKGASNKVVHKFIDNSMDFIYLDQQHDYQSVHEDLINWWPKLKVNGILALRNYSEANKGLKKAADEFIGSKTTVTDSYLNEIMIFKY